MAVYGEYRYFDSGKGWWRTKVDYSGSSATVTLEVKSGYTVWVNITGKVNGTANSTLSYSSSATATATLGTVSINPSSSNTIALTCSGGAWGQDGTSTATIPAQQYTISYNANGGSGTPSSSTVTIGSSYTIPSDIPTRSMYNFLGYTTGGTTYQPGASFTPSGNVTLTASWSQPSVATTTSTTYTAQILRGGMYWYVKFVPTVSARYTFEGTASTGDSADTYGYLYDSSGSQLSSNDDSGDGSHFLINYDCTANTTYYIGVRYYSDSYTGDITVKISRNYTVNKVNEGSTTTVYKKHGVSLSLGTASKSSTTISTWTLYCDGNGGSLSSTSLSTSYRQYYNFKEWNTNSAGTGSVISSTYTTNADLTVYAQFTESSKRADSVTLPTATWENHHFIGWASNKLNINSAQSITSYTPTSNGETLYAIWYVPKCYVKTEDGWKLGRALIKQSDGWVPNYTLYTKTTDGWKAGKIYDSMDYKVIAGPFNASGSVYRACYSNRPRFLWQARMCYDYSDTSTDEVLCQFIPVSGSTIYGYVLTFNRSTGVFKISNGNTTTSYALNTSKFGPGVFFDIQFMSAYYYNGNTSSYAVYLIINGTVLAMRNATYYYNSTMRVTFGSSGTYFTSMSFNTNYGSGSFDVSSADIGSTVTINTASTPATVTTKTQQVLW